MNRVFADTFYYIALLNAGDEMHSAATRFTEAFTGEMVTSAWVLTEVGDGLARVPNRPLFLRLVAELRANVNATIVPPDGELFEAGLELFANRPDKEWSLTDCISFTVMRRHGIEEALTGDRHFEQAGFRALLKPGDQGD